MDDRPTKKSDDFADFMDVVGAVTSMAAGAGIALAAAPELVKAAGFKKTGIVEGSPAASMMRASGGSTPEGGLVATLQSIGATSSVFTSSPATIVTGVVGALAGLTTYETVKYSLPDKK